MLREHLEMSRQFSWVDLIVVGLGGAVVGSVVTALISKSRRSADAGVPLLQPAGAVGLIPEQTIAKIDAHGIFHETMPSPASPNLRARSRMLQKPTVATLRPMRRFNTLAELLRTCPSADEMARIRNDFNIYFDDRTPLAWTCTEGGNESSAMLTVYNVFRYLYSLEFDAPMPPIGVTNLYNWLKSLNLNWYFRWPTPDDSYNHAAGQDVVINSDSMADPWTRSAWLPESGAGLWAFAQILLHEARHTDPGGAKGHVYCAAAEQAAEGTLAHDISLSYGGAYAVGYWYWKWISNHLPNVVDPSRSPLASPAKFLPDEAMSAANGYADFMRSVNGAFCDELHLTPTIRPVAVKRAFVPTAPLVHAIK